LFSDLLESNLSLLALVFVFDAVWAEPKGVTVLVEFPEAYRRLFVGIGCERKLVLESQLWKPWGITKVVGIEVLHRWCWGA